MGDEGLLPEGMPEGGLLRDALGVLESRGFAVGGTITPEALAAAADALGQTWVAPGDEGGDPGGDAVSPPKEGSRDSLAALATAAATWLERLPTLRIIEASAAAAASDLRGTDLIVGGILGRGGMGVIHEARQRALDRNVAVKVLRADGHGEHGRALLREALIMGQLEHPNVVPVHTLGRVDASGPALVMKRIEGVSWSTLIHRPEEPLWATLVAGGEDRLGVHLAILTQVCRALEFAHSRGILHRDVKPENVMVGAYGEVYLVDWGIALHLDERDPAAPVAVLGTPAYMAPEMVRGELMALDTRTDVYLLGATLHEVLTQRPRHREAGLLATLTAASISAAAAIGAGIPEELAAIVHRATAADPAARFPSVAALREAVAAYLHHRGSRALAAEAEREAAQVIAAIDAIDAALERSAEDGESDGEATVRAAYPAIQAGFATADFGFTMALREWPGNREAVQGRGRLLARMIRLEIARGDLEQGARLLGQWSAWNAQVAPGAQGARYAQGTQNGDPSAEDEEMALLAAELDKAREVERGRRGEFVALRELREQMDLRPHWQRRRSFFLLLGGAGLVLTVAIVGTTPEDRRMTWGQLFVAIAVFLGIYSLAVWRLRAVIMASAIDRRLVAGVGVSLSAVLVQRLVAWSSGLSISQAFTDDLLLLAVCLVMMGVTLERRLLVVSLPYFGGVVAAMLLPDRTGVVFGVSTMVGIGVVLWALGGRVRDAASPARRD